MAKENQMSQEDEAPLYGDVLEAIFSHVPLVDLVPASYVSKSWQRTISSCLRNPARAKPWLVIHIQSPWNPLSTVARAYDPNSHVWIEVTGAPPANYTSPLRSSHSSFLYMLMPSKFSFSVDAMNHTWQHVNGPKVWRSDPIVAVIRSHVVVAGGTHAFEDDPLAVEMFDMKAREWAKCQPMPITLKDSAATTWLSVAVSDQKMYLLEKQSGTFCSFDPESKTWSGTSDIRPNPSIYFSVLGYSGNHLILVGLMGDSENTGSLRIWEVNSDSFQCNEIGRMPSAMLEKLKAASLPSIDISVAENFIYIYNSSDPKNIFYFEFTSTGHNCEWGAIQNSIFNDKDQMERLIFTCSKVGLDDLQKVYRNRRFAVTLNGK